MPFTSKDAVQKNSSLKGKSKKIRQWVKIANSTFSSCMSDGGSDSSCSAKAIRIANGVVKEGIDMNQCNIPVSIDLSEAKFDDETRTAEVTILNRGWSMNGFFYSDQIAEGYAKILEEDPTAHKMFLNHSKNTRGLNEWVATIQEAWGDKGKTRGKISFTSNPSTSWLYEEAKRNPSQVQLSHDSRAKVQRNGSAEGRKGNIVQEWIKANSVDFVTYASAGGGIDRVLEELMVSNIIEDLHQVRDRLSKMSNESVFYNAVNAFREALNVIVNSYNNSKEDPLTDDERKTLVSEAVEKMMGELDKVDYSKIGWVWASLNESNPTDFSDGEFNFTIQKIEKETGNISEATSFKIENGEKYESKAYLIVSEDQDPSTWKFRIEESPDNVTVDQLSKVVEGFGGEKEKLTSSQRSAALKKLRILYKERGVEDKDLPPMLSRTREGLEAIMNSQEIKMENVTTLAELKEALGDNYGKVVAEIQASNEAEKELSSLRDEVKELKETNASLQAKVTGFEVKEKTSEFKFQVDKAIEDAGIKDKVKEKFVSTLYALEDLEKAQTLINQVSETVKANNGQPLPKGNGEVSTQSVPAVDTAWDTFDSQYAN